MMVMASCSGSEISHQVGIVCNILSRLPAKSLMRFKCVSKDWRYIIQGDKYFSDLFHAQSNLRPYLLIVSLLPWDPSRCLQGNLLTTELCGRTGRIAAAGGAPIIHNINSAKSKRYHGILEQVKGMMCFTNTSWDSGVRIYNLGTRELTPWLESTFNKGSGCRFDRPCYQFGFDPATKEHKVICLWRTSYKDSHSSYSACEVLTVGNNAWRIIEGTPPYGLEDNSVFTKNGGSVYVNGSIYWITDQFNFSNHGSEHNVIVAFDVGSEKFRTIPLPKLITDQLWYDDDNWNELPINLFEVNDRVGVLRRLRVGYPVKLWILNNEDDEKNDVCTMGYDESWTEIDIELPFEWDEKTRIKLQGVPGTYDILIETYTYQSRCLSLFYFNRRSMTFTKVETDKLCSSIPHLNSDSDSDSENASKERYVSLVSTFTESLLPFNKKSA